MSVGFLSERRDAVLNAKTTVSNRAVERQQQRMAQGDRLNTSKKQEKGDGELQVLGHQWLEWV